MKPKISIIMPVYNTEKYLKEAIKSILNQSFSDFEFIIVDDGSSDKSFEICDNFAKQDKRIKLFRNEKNMGISFTRNRLISLARADFIAIQDSDDISFKNRLELEYDFLEKNEDFAVVSGDNLIIDEDGKKIGKREYSDEIEKIILKKSPISQPGSMFRKKYFEEVGGYDKSLNYGEDYDLWLKIFSKGKKIKNLKKNLIQYRIHEKQTKSEKLKKTLKNTLFIQKRAIKKYGIKASFSDKIYHFLEKILLFFPSSFILFIFKKLSYKNEKSNILH